MILTPDQQQARHSEFRLFLHRPIKLNPSFEWEVGIVDTHIESHASTIIQIDNKYEEYWFRYIYEVPEVDVDTYIRNIQKDKYSSHQKYYFNPKEYSSAAESFAAKINNVTREKHLYDEFGIQGYPQTLKFKVSNEHMLINVIREMSAKNEAILIQMPPNQFKDVFGSDVKYWETYFKGNRLVSKRIGFEIQSKCFYLKNIDCLVIIATDVNIYRTAEQHLPAQEGFLDVEFRSPTKIKKHSTVVKPGKNMMIDIECDLLETTRIGQTNGGTKVMGVCKLDGNTIVNPKYFPIETRVITSIYIKMYKSNNKSQIVIIGRPYIVINIRPKSVC